MNLGKTVTLGIAAVSLVTMTAKGCAGNTNPAVYDGTTFTTANYGMYSATAKAGESCKWYVTVVKTTGVNKRKKKTVVVASGGKHDSIIAGSALRGGTLHTNCGTFTRAG